MRVISISPTIQEFAGCRYYLCGFYFQRNGVRLHRDVWRVHYGPIPPGYHIHHRDGNRANNQIENLELKPGREHTKGHANTAEFKRAQRQRFLAHVAPKAAAWHRSPEGRRWHSKQARRTWEGWRSVTQACQVCGKTYQTYRPDLSKYCHPKCRQKALRRRRAGLRK